MTDFPQQESNNGPWLEGMRDSIAGFSSFTKMFRLGDITGEGQNQLIITDNNQKIRAYKGVNISWEKAIKDQPVGMALFYSDQNKTPCANIALACEKAVYIYKNKEAFFKFTLPLIEIPVSEVLIFEQALISQNYAKMQEDLKNLKQNSSQLSIKSLIVLSCADQQQQIELLQKYKQSSFKYQDQITCIESINKSSQDVGAISQLILGSEAQFVYILDQTGTQIEFKFILQGIPVFICTQGVIENQYQIIIATRSQKIFIFQNGQIQKKYIDVENTCCGMVTNAHNIYVAQMDKQISVYNYKCNKIYQLKFDDNISCIENLEFGKSQNVVGLLVALKSQEIRLYNERQLIYTLKCDDQITGMRFGNFGRENGSLVIVYKSKGLDVRILQRKFNFSNYTNQSDQDNEESVLQIPKRTQYFLNDMQREVEFSKDMYHQLNQDLMKMRYQTAQDYLNVCLNGNQGQQNHGKLRLHAKVEGLGPLFKIFIKIENLGKQVLNDLYLTYSYDQSKFNFTKTHYQIPLLIPNFAYSVQNDIINTDPNGAGDVLKIFINQKGQKQPLLGAVVLLPLSEIQYD